MTVPDYQTLMLPVLQVAVDGQEHTIGETIEIIAGNFGLTDVDRMNFFQVVDNSDLTIGFTGRELT